MTISAHQPAYIPWLGYLNKMKNCDLFVILDDVQYSTGDFINRNKIMTSRGPKWLTIPLEMRGHLGKTIREMKIADPVWHVAHWNMFQENYGHATHFVEWMSRWMEWMLTVRTLTDACDFTTEIARMLGITTPVEKQSQRGIGGSKLELIRNLCQFYGADTFLFGTEGFAEYGYALEEFCGVRAVCQDYTAPDEPPVSVMHYLLVRGTQETGGMI